MKILLFFRPFRYLLRSALLVALLIFWLVHTKAEATSGNVNAGNSVAASIHKTLLSTLYKPAGYHLL